MKALLRKFVKDESGLETVEYAIILGLIVAGTIALVIAIGQWVHGKFDQTNTEIHQG